jgi:hypothetical protein
VVLYFHSVQRYWVPTYTHPDGASHTPHYFEDDGRVYPYGIQTVTTGPWYMVTERRVYPTAGHPQGPSESAWFELVGSFVYPTPHHPARWPVTSPVYQLTDDPQPNRAT